MGLPDDERDGCCCWWRATGQDVSCVFLLSVTAAAAAAAAAAAGHSIHPPHIQVLPHIYFVSFSAPRSHGTAANCRAVRRFRRPGPRLICRSASFALLPLWLCLCSVVTVEATRPSAAPQVRRRRRRRRRVCVLSTGPARYLGRRRQQPAPGSPPLAATMLRLRLAGLLAVAALLLLSGTAGQDAPTPSPRPDPFEGRQINVCTSDFAPIARCLDREPSQYTGVSWLGLS